MGHIDDIAERYVDEWAPLNPIGATYVGISGYDHRLNDLSPEGYAAVAELDRRTLAQLDLVEPAHEREGSRRRPCRSGSASPWSVTTRERSPAK